MNPCNEQTDFEFGPGTGVYQSCSIVWKDEIFVFGGRYQSQQISKVQNCQLKLIGQLKVKFNYGACTNVGNELVFFCFYDFDDPTTDKKCLKATSPLGDFQETRYSTHHHSVTRIDNNGG